MIWFLLISVFLLGTYLYLLNLDLKNYHDQLSYIMDNETNQELTIKTRFVNLRKITLLNNQLIRKQKLSRSQLLQETSNLEQAIHNISHDLRTPLSVASGYTQILQQQTSSPEQQEMLTKIKNNLDLVNNHLEHLLDYQRINENQLQLQLETIDLSRLLQKQLLSMYPNFEQAGFQLTNTVDTKVTLISDPSAWQRIFQNVLGNILEHGQGPVTIFLEKTTLGIHFTAQNHLKEPIEHPDKLTERFYTEDLSRQKQNAGIGLYIVKELVARLGGQMEIKVTNQEFIIEINI